MWALFIGSQIVPCSIKEPLGFSLVLDYNYFKNARLEYSLKKLVSNVTMFQYAAQCLIFAPIFIATVSGFWSCVDDLSSNPKRLTCSAIASEKLLFYMSPILPIRMSITITSNSVTLNHTKGFNWRTVNSSSQIEHCESVEAITSLGASKLSFICLFGTYQDGSYPMKVKLAPKITVNLKMIVEAETTRKGNMKHLNPCDI